MTSHEITDDKKLSQIFNYQYVNIVEITMGTAPTTLGEVDVSNKKSINNYINKIVEHYKDHPSIKAINEHRVGIDLTNFKIPSPVIDDIDKILKDIDVKKAPGPDLIPPVLIKSVSHIINEPLKDVIKDIISGCIYPDEAKIAHVTPAFKTEKTDRHDKVNYRPISVIGTFSKIL